MSKFNVGDEVFSIKTGWGKVQEVDNYVRPTILVDSQWYQEEGKRCSADMIPSLYTKEEALVRFPEFPPPKRMKKVKGYMRVYTTSSTITYGTSFLYLNRAQLPDTDGAVVEVEIEVEVEDV